MLHGSCLSRPLIFVRCGAKRTSSTICGRPRCWCCIALSPNAFSVYEIQAAATIGRRFTIHHGYAVVINKNVVAGDDFTIRHGVTIGNRGADNMACPHIGNGVELGANVIILGDITLGNNVTVGAGSVVLDSVPDNALVVGEKSASEGN
ncbi:putative acetyltransferase [Escherichia coli]|nr:putative acetyltransferase [Escherichia coli]